MHAIRHLLSKSQNARKWIEKSMVMISLPQDPFFGKRIKEELGKEDIYLPFLSLE
jgi:hypothetical protein